MVCQAPMDWLLLNLHPGGYMPVGHGKGKSVDKGSY